MKLSVVTVSSDKHQQFPLGGLSVGWMASEHPNPVGYGKYPLSHTHTHTHARVHGFRYWRLCLTDTRNQSSLALKMVLFYYSTASTALGCCFRNIQKGQSIGHHLNQWAAVSGTAICLSIWHWGNNYGVIDGLLAVLGPWYLQLYASYNLFGWRMPLWLRKQRWGYRIWLASVAAMFI